VSQPRTSQELADFAITEQLAGPAENVVSTQCPHCHIRFAMLATYSRAGWHLRCTRCSHQTTGELKQ
jgi:hypothetical protein